jgi:DNA-directed RNA polymerase specialized sigma24 family protein
MRDLTHEKIAATLEVPVGSVKSGLRRALKALKELL